MTSRRTQRSVSAGMKMDQKSFDDDGIPNPIILQMNYAQAIKRSAHDVAAARAGTASSSAATSISTTTTSNKTPAATSVKGRVHPPPPHSIWTTVRGRSDSCMSDVSDGGSTSSSPASSVSNSSMDSINQFPLVQKQQQKKKSAAVRDSSPTPSAESEQSEKSKKRSLESKRRASRKKNQKRREVAKRNKALLNASNTSLLSSSSDSLTNGEQQDTTQEQQLENMSNTSSASLSMSPPESPSMTDESSPSADSFVASTLTSREGEVDKDSVLEIIVDKEEHEPENDTTILVLDKEAEGQVEETAEVQLPLEEQTESSPPATPAVKQEKDSIVTESLDDEQEHILTVDNVADEEHESLTTVMEEPDLELTTDADTVVVAAVSAPLALAEENVWTVSTSTKTAQPSSVADKDIIEVMDDTTSTEAMTTTTAQTEQQSLPQIPLEIKHEPAEPVTSAANISSNDTDSQPNLSSWDVASERVSTVALQCLIKDKDMELSYVAILSAITVLQSKDEQPDFEDLDRPLSAEMKAYKAKVAASYSQILDILCKSDVAESLGKETLRQGVMAPEELYAQFYGSVQQAGYDLQDDAHLSMAQYWTDRKKIEEAQECIHCIEFSRWTNPVYRAAITCHLFAKPRQSQEAEGLLQKYIDSQDASQSQAEAESKIRSWYRLQLDASKWEEVKAQYERRRARLVDAPANIERVEAESRLTPQALQQLQEQQRSPQRNLGHKRSISIASSTTSSSHRRAISGQLANSPAGHQRTPSSSSHQRTPSGALNWPSGASATLNAPTPTPAKSGFSFLSPFKFGSKSTDTDTTQSPATPTALPSRIHVTRHLTVLDNNMLEECIAHKEFEYGWKNVYERMGPTLEDGETAKIAMRLCRRAFLGHSGMSPNEPGSPNVIAKDFSFTPADQESSKSKQDPELWEARAWVIYNKAMMNSGAFLSSSSSGAGSTPSNASGASAARSASMSVSVFMHDILTIAIHSPEVSSRYLKAFKVYSGMRSDAHYHQQLRDPFVMGLMLKAIYDAGLAVINNPDQQLPKTSEQKAEAKKHHRRSSSLSLNRAQPMTLGPLMDLAFEIYADMRNVGPIRHLPSLVSLTPSSPTSKHSRQGSLSRISTSSSRSTTSQADATSENATSSTVSISPRSSFTVLSMPVFQELNSTLKANPQARRLAPELYLALLHLCIHVPVFRISSQVVKTIVNDMSAGSARQVPHLDLHLAAALQSYHDTWMCSVGGDHREDDESDDEKCNYYEWMYQSEEAFQDQLSKANRLSTQSVMSMASATSGSGAEAAVDELEKELEEAQLAFGSGVNGETCNDQLYWDLWSMEDAALKSVQFSKKKAAMLWTHVSKALL